MDNNGGFHRLLPKYCYRSFLLRYPTIADESTKTFTQYDDTAVVPFARTVSDSPPASHGCRRASSAVMRLHGSASRRRPNRSLAFVDTDSHTSWVEFREMHARNGNSWSDLVLQTACLRFDDYYCARAETSCTHPSQLERAGVCQCFTKCTP